MQKVVNIQITIDTEGIMANFPQNPNPDPTNPTHIGHTYSYMVASRDSVFSSQTEGTADLEVEANIGDYINWHITSEYGNVQNPVLMTDIFWIDGPNVFNDTTPSNVDEKTIILTDESTVELTSDPQTFCFYSAHIENSGVESYGVYFVLYKTNGSQLELYDYFRWDPTINVPGVTLS